MSKTNDNANWMELREAVFVRDQHQCTCCLGAIESVEKLYVDHTVPRGAGGSDRLSNLNTLCRRCHDAKHGNGIAPTVRWESPGDMTSIEFAWYQHVMKDMLPAMARSFKVRLQPKFALADDKAWYLPLGDLRRLDKQILEADSSFSSFRAEQYW